MTRWLGAGNDKTYCGRGDWLFYRPDIDYVMNHGFLDKSVMARRAASGSETVSAPQPDPRPAIIAFNAELAARGIKLILMPTPVKPVIHPEKFAAGFENFTRPVQNRDYQKFIRDMENFDTKKKKYEPMNNGSKYYLTEDEWVDEDDD